MKNTLPSSPVLSRHFQTREPSAIRLAQIEFAKRKDAVTPLNTAIGNVSLPMHPALQKRMKNLGGPESPFRDGIVKYSPTVGEEETRKAFLNIIASSGFATEGLNALVTDGGSQAMELIIIGTAGAAGTDERPVLLIDAAYVNYRSFAERVGRATVSIGRRLQDDGSYTLPDLSEIESVITRHRPGAMVVIPYDNPTGQLYTREMMVDLARICVRHNLWMVSDEAYRELHYLEKPAVSVWGLSESEVPGITGRRMSIETASKVWNACGLRIGGIVTDNPEFHRRAVAEYTANLCANVIGQYIFGALAEESREDLRRWYGEQAGYYRSMMKRLHEELTALLPGIIVSKPHAAIYSVIDVRNIAPSDFETKEFVMYAVREGSVDIDGKPYTLLVSPMTDFYDQRPGVPDPGRTQMRVAYVETPERMALAPRVFAELFRKFLAR